MGADTFNPWQIESGDGWTAPSTRFDPKTAREGFRALASSRAPASVRLESALAWLRHLRKSLDVAFDDADAPESRELAETVRDAFAWFEEDGVFEAIEPKLAQAARAEMEIVRAEACSRLGLEAPAHEIEVAARDAGDAVPGDYARFVEGRACAAERDAEAERAFERALAAARSDAARLVILPELLAARGRLGRMEKVGKEAGRLLELTSMKPGRDWEIGIAHHFRALAADRADNAANAADAARESNLTLFRFKAVQTARRIGVNYFVIAKNLAEMNELGEAALIAQLSLKALRSNAERPTRAEALLLLGRIILRLGDEEKARQALEGVVGMEAELPDELRTPVEKARRLIEDLN